MVKKLRDNLFLFNTSPANAYFIIDEKVIAVDVSTPTVAQEMLTFLKVKVKGDTRQLDLITATHFHWDHIAGIELLKSMTNAKIAFHSYVKRYLYQHQKIKFPPLRKWISGILSLRKYPRMIRLPSFKDLFQAPAAGFPLAPNKLSVAVDFWLEDGQLLPSANQWQVLSTPGHVEDALCFYNQQNKIMITGDTIVNLRGKGELNPFHNDTRALLNSYNRLKTYHVKVICPGHGAPLEDEHLWERIVIFNRI